MTRRCRQRSRKRREPDLPGPRRQHGGRGTEGARRRRRARTWRWNRVVLTGTAAAARERIDAPTHPSTLGSNLAAGHLGLGRHAEAETALRRVTAGWEALGVVDGYDYLTTRQNLTVAVRRQGRTADAEELARANCELAARSLPKDHWLAGVTTKEHGGCLRELGRFDEAEPLLLLAHGLLERTVGAKDQRTQKVVKELVDLYRLWDRPADAEPWQARLAPER